MNLNESGQRLKNLAEEYKVKLLCPEHGVGWTTNDGYKCLLCGNVLERIKGER